MAYLYDHSLTRVSPPSGYAEDECFFKTSFSYVGSMTKRPKKNKEDEATGEEEYDAYAESGGTILWQYHANGRSIDTGREWVVTDSPAQPTNSPVSTKGFGSDTEPSWVTNSQFFWPYTRTRLVSVNHDTWTDGHQNVVWWPFHEPLPPKASYKLSGLKVTFSLDPNRSNQGPTSHYWVERTRWTMLVETPNWAGRKPSRYDLTSWVNVTTSEDSNNEIATYSSPSSTPDWPTRVRLVAVNEGPSGMSSIASSGEYIFSKVNKPSIRLWERTATGVTFAVWGNADYWHPIDHIILERSTDSGWTKVQDVGDGADHVNTMVDYTDGRIPGEDQFTRYRVRTWHTDEANQAITELPGIVAAGKPKAPTIGKDTMGQDGELTVAYTVNSKLKNVATKAQLWNGDRLAWSGTVGNGELNVTGLNKAVAYTLRLWNEANGQQSSVTEGTVNATGPIAAALSVPVIKSLNQIGDGVSLRLTFTYASAYGEGTEVSWATRSDGWEATSDPSKHELEDTGRPRSISIVGLKEGEEVWVRCRRYVTKDSKKIYGGWSSTWSAIPESTPTGVVLSAPTTVAVGSDIEYTWDYGDSDDKPQSKAILTINGKSISVDGSATSYKLSTKDVKAGSTVKAAVRVSTGGGWSANSATVSTLVAKRPTCVASFSGSVVDATEQEYGGKVLTAMPLSLNLSGGSSYDVTVTAANGGRLVIPTGDLIQANNDIVAHVSVADSGVVCESGLLYGGAYDVSVKCTDSATGLESEPVTLRFVARWANRVQIPDATITMNEDGQVILKAVPKSSENDILNIYRRTVDGWYLCLANGSWNTDYYDSVPSYGWSECGYAFEAVTADGDRAWREVVYDASDITKCIIDWPNGRLVLPYNLEINDTYSTNFEARVHLDGTTAGYWSPGQSRTGTVRSDGLKEDSDTAVSARALGRYAGLCYVRAPYGVAFACHADVTSDVTYNSMIRTYDIKLTEVSDDGTFNLKVVEKDA